jgi:phosphatidylserine/phosphatidylglycerophosphate/cardiolipin synthase-like enzyme
MENKANIRFCILVLLLFLFQPDTQGAEKILSWMLENTFPLTPQEIQNCREIQFQDCLLAEQRLLHFIGKEKNESSQTPLSSELERTLLEKGVFDLIRQEFYRLPGLPTASVSLSAFTSASGLENSLEILSAWKSRVQTTESIGDFFFSDSYRDYLFQLDTLLKKAQIILEEERDNKPAEISSTEGKYPDNLGYVLSHLNRILFVLSESPPEKSRLIEKIQPHFNDPPGANRIDEYLLRALDRVRFHPRPRLFAHLYQLNYGPVLDKLIQISKEVGEEHVKIILEDHYVHEDSKSSSKNNYRSVFLRLLEAGIQVRTDTYAGSSGSGQSHNKFFVINDDWIWTGSLNITRSGIHENFNHGIEINSPELNQLYAKEFQQMWNGRYQSKKWDSPMPSEIWVERTRVEVLFSPQDFIAQRVRKRLLQARSSIQVGMFYLTNADLLKALSFQNRRGVPVSLMLDDLTLGAMIHSKEGRNRKLSEFLDSEELDYRTEGTNHLFHHKFAVIDAGIGPDPMVITGSFNWTMGAAKKNDENVLIIHSPEMAKIFQGKFANYYGKVPQAKEALPVLQLPSTMNRLLREGEDLLSSMHPIDNSLFLSLGRKSFHEIVWKEGNRYIRVPEFFSRLGDGALVLEHPELGPIDTFYYSNRNGKVSRGILREWRRLAIIGEWMGCPEKAPDENCAFELSKSDERLCLIKISEMDRLEDWVPCPQKEVD